MTDVTAQYEAFPYPERDPADEAKRLITGSPSHPLEIDHFVFAGARDWSKPFRALVAGGGTGDALIQMAQVLTSARRPFEITYLDLSAAAREIAEARAKARGLDGITFVTGSLLEAPDVGVFDYIDCCGVLHHLPEPQEGFDALSRALLPDGGIGLMVYAPHGRSGVYLLQRAFGRLLDGPPAERLRRAKAIYERLPDGHPFKRNPHLSDHRQSDAGFYDLLLHAQDRAYGIGDLLETLERAGLSYIGSPQAHLYDPAPLVGDATLLDGVAPRMRMELAEDLRGTIRTHVLYAARSAEGHIARPGPKSIPHFKGVAGPKLAASLASSGVIKGRQDGVAFEIAVPPALVPALAQVDGRRRLDEIARAAQLDWLAFASLWGAVSDKLTAHGLMYYSTLLKP